MYIRGLLGLVPGARIRGTGLIGIATDIVIVFVAGLLGGVIGMLIVQDLAIVPIMSRCELLFGDGGVAFVAHGA